MEENYTNIHLDFMKQQEAVKIEIKKFNKNKQLCYFKSKDLTGKGFTDEQIDLISNLFSSAGFITEIKKYTFFGIYDPSRTVSLIELYPTDEELLQKEIRMLEQYKQKWWKL